jgi:Uma2 family endonuclease
MAVLADHVHRFSVGDYLRLVEEGDAARWESTELVEGVIYDRSQESALHAKAVHHLLRGLEAALPDRHVFIAGSVELGPDSLWNPDVYVLREGAPDDRTYPLGSDVELVVEVAFSTLPVDLGIKYRGYAAAGIAQYWVVVPQTGGYVLRHRRPAGDRYELVERFELPGGYETLGVAELLA